MPNEKVVGILMNVKESEPAVDITVDTKRIRAWKTIASGDNRVPNPALDELAGVKVGDGVEAEVFTQVKKSTFTGKDMTYYNLISISKRVDLEGPAAKPAEKKTYGKSPQERREILTLAVVNHVLDFYGRTLAAVQDPDTNSLAYWEENSERAEKLIQDTTSRLVDFVVILLGEQGIEK